MKHERKYRTIAKRLMRQRPDEFADILDSDVKIAYLSSAQEKKKNHRVIYGECHLVSSEYRWCCPYDFFIVIYEPNTVDFDDEQIEILIRHELHHIGIKYADKGLKYYIVPHDVEEFWEIIDEHGLNWSEKNAERREPEKQGQFEEGKTV